MAEHYLQFSEALTGLSVAEADWLAQQLEVVYVVGEREFTERDLPGDLSPDYAQRICPRGLLDLPAEAKRDANDEDYDAGDVDDDETGFAFELRANATWGQDLWLYAEEYGRPERVAHLVQKFLRQFRPAAQWWLTYAITCSKPRIGQFTGGAIFVTAETVVCFEAADFVEQQRAACVTRGNPTLASERIRA